MTQVRKTVRESTRVDPAGVSSKKSRSLITKRDLELLLRSHGELFSESLGIRLEGLDLNDLFKWFVASLLFGARIHESSAVRTYWELESRNLLTPEKLRDADYWEMIDVMAHGGYARYDGIATRKLQSAAAKLLDEYGGDLNRLHKSARNSADLEGLLKQFWGVGDATAGIFLRELRGNWPKANPPLGDLALLAASHLGIEDPIGFWKARTVPGYDFRHFEAALTRLGRDFCRRGRCASAPIPHAQPRVR